MLSCPHCGWGYEPEEWVRRLKPDAASPYAAVPTHDEHPPLRAVCPGAKHRPAPPAGVRGAEYTEAAAELSPCGRYRYTLTRAWAVGTGEVAFAMLNPSTADGRVDDPTIRRCVGFARAWGFARLLVVNLFPVRATDPKALLTAADPAGGQAGDAALRLAARADLAVAAWGAWVPFGREAEGRRLLADALAGRRLACLGTTKSGAPRHPLYLPSAAVPAALPDPPEPDRGPPAQTPAPAPVPPGPAAPGRPGRPAARRPR